MVPDRELILALDVDHYGWLRQAAPDGTSLAKIRMLRSFDPAVAGKDALDQGIEDPWYGGHADFEATWELIQAAVPGIVEHVRAELQRPEAQHHGRRRASGYALFHEPSTRHHRHRRAVRRRKDHPGHRTRGAAAGTPQSLAVPP